MAQSQRHGLPPRHNLRSLNRTLDLSPIKIFFRENIKIDIADASRTSRESVDEVVPDLFAGGDVEWGVVYCDVDSGFEGWVDGFDAVGG